MRWFALRRSSHNRRRLWLSRFLNPNLHKRVVRTLEVFLTARQDPIRWRDPETKHEGSEVVVGNSGKFERRVLYTLLTNVNEREVK